MTSHCDEDCYKAVSGLLLDHMELDNVLGSCCFGSLVLEICWLR